MYPVGYVHVKTYLEHKKCLRTTAPPTGSLTCVPSFRSRERATKAYAIFLPVLYQQPFTLPLMPHPPQLPPHLSYKSALVLLLPQRLQPPIERVRRVHDRNFQRWPPHVNLIYPFLSHPSSSFEADIKPRAQHALQKLQPVPVCLRSASHFAHSSSTATVWLPPEELARGEDGARDEKLGNESIKRLQAELQAEFAECNADGRPFTPHLSVGQAKSSDAAKALEEQIVHAVQEHMAGAHECSSNTDAKKDVPKTHHVKTTAEGRFGLEWFVDHIAVIERKGYHGRFEVVGKVNIGA